MCRPSVERIGLTHLLVAAAPLRDAGHADLAAELEIAARGFCASIATHRKSPDYRGRLRPPVETGLDTLVDALLASSDVLRQGDESAAALGAWCCALAARLAAVLSEPDPAVSRQVVFVDIDGRGDGELVLVPLPPAGLDDEGPR